MQHSDLKSQGVCSLRYTRSSSGPAVCSSIEAVPSLTESEERIVDRLTDDSMVNSPLMREYGQQPRLRRISVGLVQIASSPRDQSLGGAGFLRGNFENGFGVVVGRAIWRLTIEGELQGADVEGRP